ncbi:MAG: hypothetical protein E6180_04645 [Varibaculum cambriense]|nr:hypothetical protein [Varibaculum cambriense]
MKLAATEQFLDVAIPIDLVERALQGSSDLDRLKHFNFPDTLVPFNLLISAGVSANGLGEVAREIYAENCRIMEEILHA